MEVLVIGHNFESILPKDHPCQVCFRLADWFRRKILLNNFPIGSYVKTMPADGSQFGARSGSLNTILEVDHLRTIDDMFAILVTGFRGEDLKKKIPIGSYVKTMSAEGQWSFPCLSHPSSSIYM
jgi:hypothetical protein